MVAGEMSSVVVDQFQTLVLLVCAIGELNGMEYTGKSVTVLKIIVIHLQTFHHFPLLRPHCVH